MGLGLRASGMVSEAVGRWLFSKRAPSIWGEDLVGQPLWDIWNVGDWGDVDDDKLVFLLPRLVWSLGKGDFIGTQSEAGLRDVLCLGLGSAVTALTQNGVARDVPHALGMVERSGVLSVHSADELWNTFTRGAESRRMARRASASGGVSPAPTTAVFELAVVACLNQLLQSALLRERDNAASAPIEEAGLGDALVGSIHARFNGGYAFPKFAWAHELFATGAWLGHLLDGRRALMLDFIADCLLDYRAAAERNDNTDAAICGRILQYHAECAIGADRLHDLASGVRSGSGPVMVHPRRLRGTNAVDPYVWNSRLFASIEMRLNLDDTFARQIAPIPPPA